MAMKRVIIDSFRIVAIRMVQPQMNAPAHKILCGKGDDSVIWFAKVLFLLRLRCEVFIKSGRLPL